jgi:hypothetical protein
LHHHTVSVPYVHLLPVYRPQLDISLPPEDDPKILTCCALSENLTQFSFDEFQHNSLKMNTSTILNDPTSRNLVDLNYVIVKARQLAHLYLSIDKETFDSNVCR